MYPAGELNRLAARKALLQARIAVRRHECALAAHQLGQPLALLDRALALWRKVAPLATLAGVPLALLSLRKHARHSHGGKLSRVMAALPVILRGVRLVRQMKASRNGAAAPA